MTSSLNFDRHCQTHQLFRNRGVSIASTLKLPLYISDKCNGDDTIMYTAQHADSCQAMCKRHKFLFKIPNHDVCNRLACIQKLGNRDLLVSTCCAYFSTHSRISKTTTIWPKPSVSCERRKFLQKANARRYTQNMSCPSPGKSIRILITEIDFHQVIVLTWVRKRAEKPRHRYPLVSSKKQVSPWLFQTCSANTAPSWYVSTQTYGRITHHRFTYFDMRWNILRLIFIRAAYQLNTCSSRRIYYY